MPRILGVDRRLTIIAAAAASVAALIAFASGGPRPAAADTASATAKVADIKLFSPKNGDEAGLGNRGWFVDLRADFNLPLERTGFTGLQLTGPAGHNNVPPFPGTFSMGQDDRFKGLIVLVATNQAGAGSNVANLFNVSGVTNRDADKTQIWDTWIVGAPVFGQNTDSTVYAAIAADKNHNGILDDAPASIADADGDGDIDEQDLQAFGVASNVEQARFHIRD